MSVTTDSTGTLITNSTNNNNYFFVISQNKQFNPPFIIEFDIVNYTGNCIIRVGGNNSADRYFSALTITGDNHVKIEVNNNKIVYKVDGVISYTNNNFTGGTSYISFIVNNGSLKYHNFQIYTS
ncbi:MAG: hypothetical protein IJN90_08265 [Bacilli bacterium]|nr:hypothetical protein [Methanosphaera sp.]MBQ7105835.1 hypothetical protein [Bacilli bacterium]MBQ7277245.1 hypothetical protein [Bacilli bacterium]